ncbi:signal transduction histidine kinase [Ulvibacter sp. MAR_2010_11]|uniref:tetratricopeptide repeat-containing sensor histidine kinase n=1 Tax=Ulvibacter sp. MAR_2010_11 TaxID=1250229 RepID=UPI000CC9244F|nr:sensor histidine kinase [Ulvibacter sp. MAR_2010_11]PKA82410.1 signal transduction histidine kinase [Ulvibacter sp. MAR_2010_11]
MPTKNLRFTILLLFSFTLSFSQETQKNIDSLLLALKRAPEDSTKVYLYQKIAGHYNVTHLDSAKAFAESGVALAEKLNFNFGKIINLNALGNYFERKTDYNNSLRYYNKALEIAKATNSTKGYAIVYNNIATVYIRKAEYQKAIPLLFDALKAEETLNNENGIAQSYNNIGIVYYYMQDFDKTTEYLTKALEIQERLGNFAGLQNGYNNVGAIYDHQEKYDEAIGSYQKAYEISLQIGDKKEQASNLSNIALAYSKKRDYLNAEAYFNQSIMLREEVKDFNGLANTYLGFGESFKSRKQFQKAKFYLQKGLEIAEKHHIKLSAKEGYASLSELAEQEKDYKTANEYLYKFIAVKDSILNEKNAQIITEAEAKYETEKKENEILKQRAQLAEKDLQVRRKNTLVYGGFSLALVLGLLGYLLYNQQKLKNNQLQKENELKTALARIETQNKLQEQRLRISRDLHDNIGAQLTFIISSLDNIPFGFKDIGEKLTNKLSGISNFTSQTIYELRDTIWAMNKNDISFEDLQTRITNFIEKAKIASGKTAFEFHIDKGISAGYTFTSVEGMNIYRIIQEAVNNSMKYAQATLISVHISEKNSTYKIEIKDNGNGFIPSEAEEGNGLTNMKKRAREIDGTFTVHSIPSEGTTVKLELSKKS